MAYRRQRLLDVDFLAVEPHLPRLLLVGAKDQARQFRAARADQTGQSRDFTGMQGERGGLDLAAAHAAGLGQMGLGKFFLTPQFGPRQMFCTILTDAEADQYDAVSQDAVCDQCGECLRACPVAAYAEGQCTTVPLCEGEATWRTLRGEYCLACNTGRLANPFIPGAEPWRFGAACGRACVAHLEDEGRLSRKFVHPFREKKNRADGR